MATTGTTLKGAPRAAPRGGEGARRTISMHPPRPRRRGARRSAWRSTPCRAPRCRRCPTSRLAAARAPSAPPSTRTAASPRTGARTSRTRARSTASSTRLRWCAARARCRTWARRTPSLAAVRRTVERPRVSSRVSPRAASCRYHICVATACVAICHLVAMWSQQYALLPTYSTAISHPGSMGVSGCWAAPCQGTVWLGVQGGSVVVCWCCALC
mmetsp:Transcript_21852/g.55597  ORF Transcript_21852/g.55597 Transcript_21852/m.55597 type:complete len:214 (-) Transcript_21852:216-857(-)